MQNEDKLADAEAQARATVDAAEEVVMAIKTGDVVLHRPSGEKWLVAYAEYGYVCPCGWPETLANERDCQLLESATEEERIHLLRQMADKHSHDTRWRYARHALGLPLALLLCALILPSAPLLSDGDEIASVGTVTIISPHPSWAAPAGGSQWISIAQTGWPLATWLPNGTVVSFSEVFSLASMPSSATVTFAADDSASLWLNGSLVVAEASMAGNAYTVCSDFAPTCLQHTSVDVLPWLLAGDNVLRFDVAQRGGWSFGLNYVVGLTWLDDPPLPTPEPGTAWVVSVLLVGMLAWAVGKAAVKERNILEAKVARYEMALLQIKTTAPCSCLNCVAQQIARRALEKEQY